jgi:Rod binding domain-containing protein
VRIELRNPASLTPAQPAGPNPADEKLKEVAQEFEAIFLQTLLKEARQGARLLSNPTPSMERETYEAWQDESLARAIASGSGIGLGELIYRQLQEEQLRLAPPPDKK